MFDDLTEDNFLLYAIKAFDSPSCVLSEFEEEMNRIQYIKRLFTKYYNGSELKDRLIINHLMVLYNVFGVEAATRILFYKLEEKDYSVLKTFLVFLNFMPGRVRGIRGKDIIASDISLDVGTVRCLRKIK
jgi:hypothetical protein